VKAIPKSAAADAESYRPELVESDEPRYLRRQKPVEIRRKKFGGKNLSRYRSIFSLLLFGAGALLVVYVVGNFLLHSPKVLLLRAEQVQVAGNHFVTREAVLAPFYKDRNHSVLRIPLDARRSEVEQIPWVQSASIQRILPNRLRIDINERTPIAFIRNGSDIALIDEFGVFLDRPRGEEFRFPIVTGLSDTLPRTERQRRMQNYQEFIRAINMAHSRSSDQVSEVDLSNPKELRVVMAGIPGAKSTQAVTLFFNQNDFAGRYSTVVQNFSVWQAENGCVQSIDLRYRLPVLNPDTSSSCGKERK
jgi:cell division protein FtsQ